MIIRPAHSTNRAIVLDKSVKPSRRLWMHVCISIRSWHHWRCADYLGTGRKREEKGGTIILSSRRGSSIFFTLLKKAKKRTDKTRKEKRSVSLPPARPMTVGRRRAPNGRRVQFGSSRSRDTFGQHKATSITLTAVTQADPVIEATSRGWLLFGESTVRASTDMDSALADRPAPFDLFPSTNVALTKALVRQALDLEHTVIGSPLNTLRNGSSGLTDKEVTSCWKAWSSVEASSLQSSLVAARSPRNHQALVTAIENDELLRQSQSYWTDERIKEVEAAVWAAQPSPYNAIVTSSCVVESEVEEEVLSTLAHREGLRIAGVTCPMVSFHCLGFRSHWRVEPVSHSRRLSS